MSVVKELKKQVEDLKTEIATLCYSIHADQTDVIYALKNHGMHAPDFDSQVTSGLHILRCSVISYESRSEDNGCSPEHRGR